jgi:hypothetical protein
MKSSASVQLRQLLPNLPLALTKFFRNRDLSTHIQITTAAVRIRQSVIAQAEALTALRPGRNFQSRMTFERRHPNFRAKRRLPGRKFYLVNQIASFHRKIRMPRQPHAQKEVAAFPSALARFTLPRETNSLPFMNTARDFYLISFDFLRTAPPQRHLSRGTMERFFELNHDIGFHVVSARRTA